MTRTRLAWGAAVGLFLAMSDGRPANSGPPPEFHLSAPVADAVEVMGQTHPFSRRSFDPPFKVKPVTKAAASYATAEDAAIANISATLAGDVDWWLDGWDPVSREALLKKPREYWARNWSDYLSGRTFVLQDRIETREFVLFEYEIDPTPTVAELRTGTIVFHQQGARWSATREFASDPVHLFWNVPDRGRSVKTLNP